MHIFGELFTQQKHPPRKRVKTGGERVKNGAKKGTENGSEKGMETGARNGVAGRTEKGRKRERKTGRENGRETGVKSGAEQRRNGSEKRARQNGWAFRKMLCGETLSGVFGRGKRIFPTDGKRKRVRIAPKPCRNAQSEYRVRRNGIKVSEIAFSPHKNGAEGETDREGDEIKRRNGKNEGIRRQRAKNGGKPTCERLPVSAEKKCTRPRIYNYGNQSVQSGRNGC